MYSRVYFKVVNICVSNAPSHTVQSFYSSYTVHNTDLEDVSIIKIILLLDLGECQISITSNIIPNKIREIKVHISGHKLRPHKKAQSQSTMLAWWIESFPGWRTCWAQLACLSVWLPCIFIHLSLLPLTFTSLLCFLILNYLHLKPYFVYWSSCFDLVAL